MTGLRRALAALLLAVLLLRPATAAEDETPWLPLSQVMAELSRNPAFVEALYTRLGRDPRAGGILGPDEIKRLRELILGKNFEALDRFPGLTVAGMGRAVRLAAAAMDHTGDKSPPRPGIAASGDDQLGMPAAAAGCLPARLGVRAGSR